MLQKLIRKLSNHDQDSNKMNLKLCIFPKPKVFTETAVTIVSVKDLVLTAPFIKNNYHL